MDRFDSHAIVFVIGLIVGVAFMMAAQPAIWGGNWKRVAEIEYTDGEFPLVIDVPANARLLVELGIAPNVAYDFELKNTYTLSCGDWSGNMTFRWSARMLFGASYIGPKTVITINCSGPILKMDFVWNYGWEVPEVVHDPHCPLLIKVIVQDFWLITEV